jgi:hypothetical protein
VVAPFPQRRAGPIDTLISIAQATSLRLEVVRAGCPLNNLAQEMSQRDERFRQRLANVFHEWQEGTAAVNWQLSDGLYEGYVMLAPKMLKM